MPTSTLKVYAASSWRNQRYDDVVRRIKAAGYIVYDFRHPPNGSAFNWDQIDPNWSSEQPNVKAEDLRRLLAHPVAARGFDTDWRGMLESDVCVLILPCGSSAHLEAGYMKGLGKTVLILFEEGRPELTYKLADDLCSDVSELLTRLREVSETHDGKLASRLAVP